VTHHGLYTLSMQVNDAVLVGGAGVPATTGVALPGGPSVGRSGLRQQHVPRAAGPSDDRSLALRSGRGYPDVTFDVATTVRWEMNRGE
jgi:hypothetical protein